MQMFDEHIKEIFNNNLKEFIRVISDLIKPKPELKGSYGLNKTELFRLNFHPDQGSGIIQ